MLARRSAAPSRSTAAPVARRALHTRGPVRAADAAARAPPAPGIKTLGVVGAGQMGMGIAQVAAQVAKVDVVVMDSNKANLDKSLAFMGTQPLPAPPQLAPRLATLVQFELCRVDR